MEIHDNNHELSLPQTNACIQIIKHLMAFDYSNKIYNGCSRENNVTSKDVHNHGLKTKHQVHLLLDTLYFILHCKVDHFFE